MAKYFTEQETEGLDAKFIEQLDKARDIAGIPFTITSGFRSPEKNQSILGSGAVADSSHLKGLASDQAVSNNHEVLLVVASLLSVGITRIGIYVNAEGNPVHVHNDMDPDKPQQVIWIKREGQPNSAPATA